MANLTVIYMQWINLGICDIQYAIELCSLHVEMKWNEMKFISSYSTNYRKDFMAYYFKKNHMFVEESTEKRSLYIVDPLLNLLSDIDYTVDWIE